MERSGSPPEVTVREATLADVDALVDLLVAVAGEGRWIATEAPVDTDRRRRRMVEDIEGADAVVLVAEAGGTPVGELGLHLAPYGVALRWRGATLAAVTGVELAAGVLLLAGVEAAAIAAVCLGAIFVAALARVRARGVRRLRCGCSGSTDCVPSCGRARCRCWRSAASRRIASPRSLARAPRASRPSASSLTA